MLYGQIVNGGVDLEERQVQGQSVLDGFKLQE